jgi:shikimate kinase/3-dehydroquinate synthase
MRHLVLSGFMATGKTTLGPRVAAELGLPFVDTDDVIAARAGKPVAELWRTEGEAAFRLLEARVLTELLALREPHVLSFGGGAVTSDAVRRMAHARAFVVTLEASPEAVLERVGDASTRPHLATENPRARIDALLRDRAAAYAESHARIATDQLSPAEAVRAIVRAHARDAVLVPLGKRSYLVEVVNDDPLCLREALEELDPTRVVVVTDALVERACGAYLKAALSSLAVPVNLVALPAGEQHKTLASAQVLWDSALGAGADRRSLYLGFGGGVVSDLAGFAASTLFRGVRLVTAPTTLLAMVDAAVGGKTGIDLAAGKNLVGTIHQPSRVVCDLAHLKTLPARERTAGLAEIVKIALLRDEELFAELEAKTERLTQGDLEALLPIVRRALELKAQFVADDETDTGVRTLLNLGHTVGHALEAHGGFSRWLHGEAVALGMVVELRAAEKLGLTDGKVSAAAEKLLASLGLPTQPGASDLKGAWRFTEQDKKRAGASLDWPIASRVGAGRVVRIAAEKLREAILG